MTWSGKDFSIERTEAGGIIVECSEHNIKTYVAVEDPGDWVRDIVGAGLTLLEDEISDDEGHSIEADIPSTTVKLKRWGKKRFDIELKHRNGDSVIEMELIGYPAAELAASLMDMIYDPEKMDDHLQAMAGRLRAWVAVHDREERSS